MNTFIKILSAFIIVAGCSYIGMIRASRLSGRAKQLSRLIFALNSLESDICFKRKPLKEAFESTAYFEDGVIGALFGEAAKTMVSPETFSGDERISAPAAALGAAIEANRSKLCLTDGDLQIITSLASQLGSGDCETEAANIKAAVEKLKRCEADAAEFKNKYYKLYASLGLFGGLFIVIILA